MLACGFLPDQLREALGDEIPGGPKITYLTEPEPRGTAGAIKFAEDVLEDRFFALNGDSLTDLDLTKLRERHEASGARATLGLYPVEDPTAFGLVRRTDDGEITEFLEKPDPSEIDTDEVSAGIYMLEKEVLDMVPPDVDFSIERQVWPELVGKGLYSQRLEGYWVDIGTPERYLDACWDILGGEVETEPGKPSTVTSPTWTPTPRSTAAPRSAAASSSSRVPDRCRRHDRRPRRHRPRLEYRRPAPDRGIGAAPGLQDRRRRDGERRDPRGRRDGRGRRHGPGGSVIGEGATITSSLAGQGGQSRTGRDCMSDLEKRVGEVDSGDQYAATMALPTTSATRSGVSPRRSSRRSTASGLIVCGMGGSAIGGDLAAAALGGRLGKPLDVVRGYGVPSWTPPERAIFCSSYSGNTEETLACYDAAEAVGAQRIVATTGGTLAEAARRDDVPVIGMPAGLQPRAAVGYTFAIAAEVAALVGSGPAIRMEIDSSAAHLEAAKPALLRRRSSSPTRSAIDPARLRLRPDEAGRLPLEVPDQREREAALLLARAAGDGSQRDRRLGGWSRRRLHGDLPRGRGSHPRELQRIELTSELVGGKADTASAGSRPRARRGPSGCSGP